MKVCAVFSHSQTKIDLKNALFFFNSGNVGNVAQVVVLVTGGCGYVGTHTVLRLLEQNVQVVVVDNLAGVTRGSILDRNQSFIQQVDES